MSHPRAVRRGPSVRPGIVTVAVCLAVVCHAAGAAATPARPTRLEAGGRWIGIPAGRWSLRQRSFGAGVAVLPVDWLEVATAVEVSATRIGASRLGADPFRVRTRLDAREGWGLSHAISIRTHELPPARLEAFGELRWSPGSTPLRILELVLDPDGVDLSDFGRLDALARARFSFWHAAAGARVAVRVGPLDGWLDGGALWARIRLGWELRDRAVALGRLADPDMPIDPDGTLVIEEDRPFVRAGLRLDLPGRLGLTGTGTAVPTGHGVAHGLTVSARWAP